MEKRLIVAPVGQAAANTEVNKTSLDKSNRLKISNMTTGIKINFKNEM